MGEHIVCPSGLAGEIRGLKTKDADVLAASKGKKKAEAINQILTSCWETTSDPGPYAFTGTPIWDQTLQGDRQYILLQVRKATHGAEYEFRAQCPQDACKARFDWVLKLDELPIREMHDEDRDQFRKENKFEAVAGNGQKVWYRLPCGEDEKRAAKLQSQHRDSLVTLALRMRIVEVDGLDVSKIRSFVNELELRHATELLEDFQAHDCGVDTEVEVECPDCYSLFDVDLPFDQNFFFPSRHLRKKNAARKLRAV